MINIEPRVEDTQSILDKADKSYATDISRAKNLSAEGLALCRTLDEPLLLARALDLAARAEYMAGSLAAAKALTEESHALRQAANDKQGIGVSLRNLSSLARLAGEFEEAEARIHQSLAIFGELEDKPQLKISIGRLQAALVYGGRFDENERLFEKAAPIYQEMGLPKPDVPTVVSAFGMMHLGYYDVAETRFKQTLRNAPITMMGYIIKNLGRIALVRGNLDEAEKYLLEALALFRRTGEVNGLGQTLGCLGMLALRRGNRTQAQEYIYENLQMAADSLIVLPSMTALSGLALLRADAGDAEAAVELYAAASQNGHVANSCWYRDVIGQQIDAAAERLSPAEVQSAKGRGQARSWRSVLPEQIEN